MQQERESADLCTNGCGFFGSTGTGGMCSVCWKKTMSNRQVDAAMPVVKVETSVATPVAPAADHIPEPSENNAADAIAVPTADAPAVAVEEENATAAAGATPAEAADEDKPVQKNKKRCWECKKKVGLTAIECRCGFVFCSGHRYPDQHSCTFDFKAADRAELARRNPGGGQFGKLDKL